VAQPIAGRQHNPNRERFDFYPTDPRWVEVLMAWHEFVGTITEPCAGDGAMVDVIKRHGYNVIAFDLEPRRDDVMAYDAFDVKSHENVITNAPFRGGYELLQHWVRTTKRKVCLLTQMPFLESAKRGRWFQDNRPIDVIVCSRRMDVGGKKSQFPHIWMVWDNSVNNEFTKLDWATDF